MSVLVPVDDEQLIVDYLAQDADVTAICAGRVATEVNAVRPCVKLIRLGGISPAPGIIDHPRLQVAALGTTKAEAKRLVQTVRAALRGIVGTHELGVVTSIDEYAGPQWLPEETGRASVAPIPRYVFYVVLTTHPVDHSS